MSNRDLTPIPTVYAGVRFRSRLEARWAVFFDALEFKWEYEPEGFHLAAGNYVPDFWFPQVSMWGEVKPDVLWRQERAKVDELARRSGSPVLMLCGRPECRAYNARLSEGLSERVHVSALLPDGGRDPFVHEKYEPETSVLDVTSEMYSNYLSLCESLGHDAEPADDLRQRLKTSQYVLDAARWEIDYAWCCGDRYWLTEARLFCMSGHDLPPFTDGGGGFHHPGESVDPCCNTCEAVATAQRYRFDWAGMH